MKVVEQYIATCKDTKALEAIIALAQNRLQALEQLGPVRLALHKGHWYAVLPAGQQPIPLGARLTPSEVYARSQKKPPDPLDYELTPQQAEQNQHRGAIGWVEDDTTPIKGHRRYYDVKAYDKARAEWVKWRALASDPFSIAFGISVEGMQEIQKLRESGYEIVINRENI